MPGIFGAIGCAPEIYEKLRQKFEEPWGSGEATNFQNGLLGGHAFPPYRALHILPQGTAFAVDGEISIYSTAAEPSAQLSSLFTLSPGGLTLTPSCRGSIALVDRVSGLWYLATDWSGTFPLYFIRTDTGLVFCSRQKPIAKLFNLSPDSLGILELLRGGYVLAGRTLFRNLQRLLPGQVLVFDPLRQRMVLRETSEAWVGEGLIGAPVGEVADRCWQSLLAAVTKTMPRSQRHAIMVSGGWDSRTLLAAATAQTPPEELLGYSHGDADGRELRIAKRVCESANVPFRSEPIDDRAFDLELLNRGVERTEDITFPYWHRAGEILAQGGFDSVSAGIYGEVLGGHYGRAMLLPGWAKARTVGGMLLGLSSVPKKTTSSKHEVVDLFQVRNLTRHWPLSEEYWRSTQTPNEALNADIEKDIQRLVARGVVHADKLIEAFITENRGTQHISNQILSCRAHMNVALPFADRDLLLLASQIPLETKIQNSLNQRMLQRHAREFLKFPCAATLLPASSPIFLQEFSRLLRTIVTGAWWRLHTLSGGRIGFPRLSWINFDFLRSGKALRAIEGNLRSALWHREAIADRINNVIRRKPDEPAPYVHYIASQLLTIYSVDRMLQ